MRLLRSVLLFALFSASVHCEGISRDDFRCETAVAHLADCCPDFPLHETSCQTEGTACSETQVPLLEPEESSCIMQLSCDAVRARGLCDSVPNIPVDDAKHTPVCQ